MRRLGGRGRIAAVVLVAGMALGAAEVGAQAPAGGMQGLWRSGDTTIRIAVDKGQVRATMAEVGPSAQALGFKPGDLSFVATVEGNYLSGQQTFRYGGSCHPGGRKVPIMGRLTPDGQVLALHNYAISIDAGCRDTGQYNITQTLWQRVPGR